MCALPGQIAAQSLKLYFGRTIPGGGGVSDADWATFAQRVLTPAFPEGFTVTQAEGQWRASDGSIQREPSLVVEYDGLIDPGKVATVAQAYKARFHQEAVGIVTMPVCMAF